MQSPSRQSATGSPQRLRKEAPNDHHLAESGSGSYAKNQSVTITSKDPLDPKRRGLILLARNASETVDSSNQNSRKLQESKRLLDDNDDEEQDDDGEGVNQEHEQQRRRLIAAEFADDSIRNSIGTKSNSKTQSRKPTSRSASLSSLKDHFSCSQHQNKHQGHYHNRQQQQQNQIQRKIQNCNDSSTREARHLILNGENCGRGQIRQAPAGHLTTGSNCNLRDYCTCATTNKAFDEKRTAAILEEMSTSAQTSKLIPAYFIAELLGTFLIVVIGDGAIGAFVLTKRQVDVFCTCFAFGVGAMIATFLSGKISGAHLNPAATFAFALDGRLKWILVPVYMAAQYLGGLLGALVLYLNYSEAINSLDGGQHSAFGSSNSTGGIFATYPASYVTVWGSLIDQIVGTAVLLFSLSAVGDTNNRAMDARHQPLVVAFVIGLICVAFSPNCGAIFNPARDLSPRLITYLFGYQTVWEPIDGTYWLLAGVLGPHIGAILGVFGYKYLIGSALRAFDRHAQLMVDLHDGGNHIVTCRNAEKQPGQAQLMQHYPQAMRRHELGDYGAAR